ncbi:MAG: DUF3787 domain-containing protein [Clostridium argentinense]|uniref:DUF3787 domain-containing protein n=1 Tax=uncultured Clostridium sp. TaxID=59620 RepID=UPI001D3163BF|nr:DUF3787 domain-containing protein [uncultured Clostridium sp.]MBS5824848.1 DUF3787 domain-containing protein [Clostridium argentinense]MDU1349972.1 DUF3787 domain-containing protein [Clostridium argentinense]
MEKDKVKDSFMEVPIEKHETAPWANIHKTKPVSRVTVPSEKSVENAKEYVDGNEK